MPRPKGSKNKPKVDAKGNVIVKEKKVVKTKTAKATKKPSVIVKDKPVDKVEVEAAKTEAAAATPVTKAVHGKNKGEAVIRPVDEEDNADAGYNVVMVGGQAVKRKTSVNPDLD